MPGTFKLKIAERSMKTRPITPSPDEVTLPGGLRFTFWLLDGTDARRGCLHKWVVVSPSGEALRRGYAITPEGCWKAADEALRRWPVPDCEACCSGAEQHCTPCPNVGA